MHKTWRRSVPSVNSRFVVLISINFWTWATKNWWRSCIAVPDAVYLEVSNVNRWHWSNVCARQRKRRSTWRNRKRSKHIFVIWSSFPKWSVVSSVSIKAKHSTRLKSNLRWSDTIWENSPSPTNQSNTADRVSVPHIRLVLFHWSKVSWKAREFVSWHRSCDNQWLKTKKNKRSASFVSTESRRSLIHQSDENEINRLLETSPCLSMILIESLLIIVPLFTLTRSVTFT